MAISPISLSRVSQNLRTNFVADSVRRSQLDLFRIQSLIAMGRRFVTPSEDPPAAARVLDLSLALQRQDQFTANLRYADNVLAAADNAIAEVNALVIEAQTIASQDVSNLTSAAERSADAELIAGIRRQLQMVGNRQFGGRFLFAGRATTSPPFVDAPGGIAYVGDTGDLTTRVGDGLIDSFNIPGSTLFGALSSEITSSRDLKPKLTEDTRLDDVAGATGNGVRTGILTISEPDGAGTFTVDLRTADTIGDIVNLMNEAAEMAGSSLTASISDTGLVVTPGGQPITITDAGGGGISSDLGIKTTQATSEPIEGLDLGVRVTSLTLVSELAAGADLDLEGGLVLTSGSQTVTVDLSGAKTVQDVINAINSAGIFVRARINDAGTGLTIINQTSGAALSIGENGGTTASDFGLRTFDATTELSQLNFGEGVGIVTEQDDLRIIAKDGSIVDINLDGAVTVADVIDLIDQAATDAGVSIAVSLAETGNGIVLTDGTSGTGDLAVTMLNLSTAALDLGLVNSVSGEEEVLTGDDASGVRTQGILSALFDLESGLRHDDTQAIALAAERVSTFTDEVTRVHGEVGARSQAMRSKMQQMQDASLATEIFLSEVQDLDLTEAITQLQRAQTQLQASLQTSSIMLNLSLLDFLR